MSMHRFLTAVLAVLLFAISVPALASPVTSNTKNPTVHRGHVDTALGQSEDANETLDFSGRDENENFTDDANDRQLEDLPPTEEDLDACVAAGDSECVTNLIKELAGDDVEKAASLTLRAANGAKTLAATDPLKALNVLDKIMDLASEMTSTEDNTAAVKISKVAADVIAKSDVQTANPQAVGKLAGKIGEVVLKPSILFGDKELAKDVVKSVTQTAKKEAIKAAYPDAAKEIKAALKEAQEAYSVQEMYPDMLEFHKELFPEDEPKPNPKNPSPT